MAEYRTYLVGSDGHIIDFEPIVCDDDAEAAAGARRRVDGHETIALPRLSMKWHF
jgi:hypothetical protein